jgi:hypothetical protein
MVKITSFISIQQYLKSRTIMLKMAIASVAVMFGLVTASFATNGAAKASASVVQGQAVRFPLQGIVPVDPPKPIPLAAAEIVAYDAKTGKEVARIKTDKDGKFKLTLPNGEYKLESTYGKDWRYTGVIKIPGGNQADLKLVFRYTGKPRPPAAGPRNPGRTAPPTVPATKSIEYDVEGNLPARIELTPGQVVDFTKVFPGSSVMVYAEADDNTILEQKWVPHTAPRTKLPTKSVIGRFEAKKVGTAKITLTFETNSGKRTTKVIPVFVK